MIRQATQSLCSLLLPSQTRLHMVSEDPARRRLILATLGSLNLHGHVFCRSGGHQRRLRDDILSAAVPLLVTAGVDHLVLDRMDAKEQARDRGVLAVAARKTDFRYEHAASGSAGDPLLWAADALAWSTGRKDCRRFLPSWAKAERS